MLSLTSTEGCLIVFGRYQRATRQWGPGRLGAGPEKSDVVRNFEKRRCEIQGNWGLAWLCLFQIGCLSEVTGLAFSLTDMGGSQGVNSEFPGRNYRSEGKHRNEESLLQLGQVLLSVVCPK